MAQKGRASASRGRKGTTKRTTAAKKKTKGQRSLGTEIVVLLILAVALLLFISNLGMGGAIGAAVSGFFFGMFGLLNWIFPLALFFAAAFYIANRDNALVGWKLLGGFGCYFFTCGFAQLLTVGYSKFESFQDYYLISAQEKLGGGVLGILQTKLFCMAFGTVGAYVIVLIGMLISAVVMTQRSILMPLVGGSRKVYQSAREAEQQHKELRQQNRELRQQQRALQRQEQKEQKAQQLQEKQEQQERRARRTDAQPGYAPITFDLKAGQVPTDEPDFRIPEVIIDHGEPEPEIVIHKAPETETPEAEEPREKEPAAREKKKNPRSSKEEIEAGIDHIKEEIENRQEEEKPVYVFPPLTLLKKGKGGRQGDSDEYLRETARKLQQTLQNFGVQVTVTNVSCGPTVTRYELQPEQGVKVSRIVALTDDIKLNLAAADIRIEAPIPGKAAVGIEVPNATNSAVMLRDLLESKAFQQHPSPIAFAVGKDIGGQPVVTDIAKMPHLLIAGATGSGKSVCINTLIMSILFKASPEEVKLIMIDPKVVELSVYNGIPHLYIPVVTDPKKAAGALNWAVAEMTERYNKFAEFNVRDLKGYNEKVAQLKDIEDENKPKKLPQVVIIVDELADLMMVAPGEVEDAICRLAQLARAAGIHLIIATQRPSVNVITGLIKANMPSRIAFSVSSGVDSRTILDMNGAEKLLGKGDMLFYPQGYQKPARVQGSFVSDQEVGQVVDFLVKQQGEASYSAEIQEKISSAQGAGAALGGERDAYFADAGRFIIEKDKASIGMLQRVFKIGFNRAARIMDQLSEAGVVGPEEGTKPRKVLMTMEEFENYVEESL